MKTIKLRQLSLVNFKGIRELTVNFADAETLVCGENGTGKTTLFDSFLWLLFGKDSTGRSDSNFNIKTLDGQGKPILHLEHSVTAKLTVDGRDMELQRKYTENWVKPRGSVEEQLKNHVTEFYVNGVKLATKREYDMEIAAIIPEDVFRMITNPFYFTAMKPEAQKAMLFDMAGDVTDEQVAGMCVDYQELLAQLNGRTMAQYTKEVQARKRACKNELDVIPSQLETAKNLMPEEEDWVALDAEAEEKKQEIQQIDAMIADKNRLNQQEYERKAKVQAAINEKRMALMSREAEVKQQANNGRNEALMTAAKVKNEAAILRERKKMEESNLNRLNELMRKAEKELEALRAEYRTIHAGQLTYPDGAFVCPTCKRPLEVADVEAKQQELQANFNRDKAARLEANKQKGMAMKKELAELTTKRDACLFAMEGISKELAKKMEEADELEKNLPVAENVEVLLASDQTIIDIKNEITELQNQLNMEAKPEDVTTLNGKKRQLNESLQELYKRMGKREQIDRANKEIALLEEKRKANAQQLADLERWEFTAMQFQKDKDAELLKRINSLFTYVSFSFVDEQLNGGEKLTCVCTVNGKPYPDVNNAGKVNAGLDIINAICKAKGITAPVFFDNAESVNQLIPSESQIIRLVVTKDKQLTIK